MPMIAEIKIPPILKIGGGAFATVSALLPRLRGKRPLIVTDAFLLKTQLADRLASQIREAGLSCEIFHETVPDPTTTVVDAIDGGSGTDTMVFNGANVSENIDISANGGRVRDYRVPNEIPLAGPPHLAIPTTAGTGSEVTRFTVITDVERGEKLLLAGDTLLPSAAVVDYELTLSMPARLTADTGTDSLTHAIEAFVSRKANPFTDALALAAMKTIWRELPTCFHHPGNVKAREAMMLAATQAAMAFSNASVALVHGMSRPLGAHFHIPHGLSNAMLLPAVTAFSAEAALDRYAECARTMGIAQAHESDEAAVDLLTRALYERNAELQVPSPKQFGIVPEQYVALVSTMAAQALASGSPQNNPRIPTAEEIERIYHQAWQ